MVTRRLFTVGLVLGASVLATANAFAQVPQDARPDRPYRGVYASGTDDYAHVVTVDGSAGSGYDTSVVLGETEGIGVIPPADSVASGSGMYSQLTGGLSYSSNVERRAVGASLHSSVRQYPQLDLPMYFSHSASGSASAGFGTNSRTRVSGAAALTFQSMRAFMPLSSLGLTPWLDSVATAAPGEESAATVSAPGQDFGGARAKYYSYTTTAGLTQQLSRRASLALGYDRQSSEFTNGYQDLTRQTGSFRFSRGITRSLSLRLGYGYTDASYGSLTRRYQYHNIDSGVDYSRDLSISRRTRLSFTTGASALRQDEQSRVDITGSATLNREIARTWRATLAYRRNGGFVETVRAPIFYDSVSASVGGLITRTLSFSTGAAGTLGHVGIASTAGGRDRFDTYTGYAALSRALGRNLALGVNYTYYRYHFQQTAALVTGLMSDVNRHSVNVSLNVWAPVLQRGRRTHVTR